MAVLVALALCTDEFYTEICNQLPFIAWITVINNSALCAGLATIPKVTSLPNILDYTANSANSPNKRERPNSGTNHKHEIEVARAENELTQIKQRILNTNNKQDEHKNTLIKRQFDANESKTFINNKIVTQSKALSNESWIPDEIRVKSLSRDLAVAKVTYDDMHNLEVYSVVLCCCVYIGLVDHPVYIC